VLGDGEQHDDSDAASRQAKAISQAAWATAVAVILLHLVFAVFVVPVFQNMFASVSLSLPQPTRAIMQLSARGILGRVYLLIDLLVLLLWFRLLRPTWGRFVLGLALPYVVITVVSIIAMFLPLFDMMNAVR
jgi:type II secretory pathway component PulF